MADRTASPDRKPNNCAARSWTWQNGCAKRRSNSNFERVRCRIHQFPLVPLDARGNFCVGRWACDKNVTEEEGEVYLLVRISLLRMVIFCYSDALMAE